MIAFLRRLKAYTNPSALCDFQQSCLEITTAGSTARRAAAKLRRWSALLWILPRSNIYIRQMLILSALTEDPDQSEGLYLKALSAFKGLTDGPYLEGYSYLLYIDDAARFHARRRGASPEWDGIMADQVAHFRRMSVLDHFDPTTPARGSVLSNETRRAHRLEPDPMPVFTCDAYTVTRRDGFKLIHHDLRVRRFRSRWNLHVANLFGVVATDPDRWPWYEGWVSKKMPILANLWRLWMPRTVILTRNEDRLEIMVGSKKTAFDL